MTTLSIDHPRSVAPAALADAVAMARSLGRPTLYSQVHHLPTTPDPLAFLSASSRALGGAVFWDQTGAGIAFAGAGSAYTIRANGPGRFSASSAALRDVSSRLVHDEDAVFPIIGGFAFGASDETASPWRNFPDAMLNIPQVVLQMADRAALIRVTLQIDPGLPSHEAAQKMRSLVVQAHRWAHIAPPASPSPCLVSETAIPDRRVWEASVATAVALIRQGMLDKVVLAREERLLFDGPVSPIATLARLRAFDPYATRFAMQLDGAWIVGATPERLVRLQDGRVDVTCLAGSIGIGSDENERRRLAARLLASAKDREEHEIVVRSTVSALEEVCEDVTRFPGTPRVVAARSVQHLQTPITARLSSAGHVLDLVERLHPTPAVGGQPRDIALSVIRELEAIDRGWYAGPIGWTDLDGSGEFAVAIRSALLCGHTASLFAGCGIVTDSDPAAEFAESLLKLRPMLTALGAA